MFLSKWKLPVSLAQSRWSCITLGPGRGLQLCYVSPQLLREQTKLEAGASRVCVRTGTPKLMCGFALCFPLENNPKGAPSTKKTGYRPIGVSPLEVMSRVLSQRPRKAPLCSFLRVPLGLAQREIKGTCQPFGTSILKTNHTGVCFLRAPFCKCSQMENPLCWESPTC